MKMTAPIVVYLCLCFTWFAVSDACRIRDRSKFRMTFYDGYPQTDSQASGSSAAAAGIAEVLQNGQWIEVSPNQGWRQSGWNEDMSWMHELYPEAADYIAGIEGARAILAGLHDTQEGKYYDYLEAGAWPSWAFQAFIQAIITQ